MTAWTGLPPDPTADGWHWLRRGGGLVDLIPAWWEAESRTWSQSDVFDADLLTVGAIISHGIEYVGPCVMP